MDAEVPGTRSPVLVKMFGLLHTHRVERGLEPVVSVEVPAVGVTASELAESLGLPVEKIEGVFCGNKVWPLTHRILPGDTAAFVPQGIPGPHRYSLGIYSAGKKCDNGG